VPNVLTTALVLTRGGLSRPAADATYMAMPYVKATLIKPTRSVD
jgi:hypothetical protein